MPDNNIDTEKSVSWKWLAGIAVLIIVSVVGAVIADTRSNADKMAAKIDTLQKEKVDWAQYRCDIQEIKSDLKILIGEKKK